MNQKEREIVEKFFAHFPVCHAIPRANEALAMRTVELTPPTLDLGCGDGKFALFAFGSGKIAVGLDNNKGEVHKAQKSGAYKKVIVSDGDKTPFGDGSFGSVIANSVLEHIEDLEGVLPEVARILRKDGTFAATVPTPLVSDYQFWAKFIPGYARFKEKLWRHVNYFGEAEWRERLEKVGFKVVSVRRTNSKAAISWADIFFPLWLAGPMSWTVSFLEKRGVFGFNRDGATLLIVAKKR